MRSARCRRRAKGLPAAPLRAAFAAAALMVAAPGWGQTDVDADPPPRAPVSGLPILDCAPSLPAPPGSCVLRMPPGREREALRWTATDADADRGSFELVRPGDSLFPDELTLSETLLLIDLTPGVRNGRAATFPLEKTLLRRFVEALPEDEPLAIYGFDFDEKLHRLAGFSTDRDVQVAVIDGLRLQGVNTLIGTRTREAIDVLAGRDDVLQRNLILVTDGDEEGTGTASDVSKAAVAADVSISALGMFWRPVGVPETGRGKDYLAEITRDTRGAFEAVQLRLPEDAEAPVARLADRIAVSRRESGLIVPRDGAGGAVIRVTLTEPIAGVEGGFRDAELRATVALEREAEPVETRPGWRAWMLGLAWWVWALIGAAVLLIAAAVVLLARRAKPEEAEPEAPAEVVAKPEPAKTAGLENAATRHVAPPVRAWAYLVRQDTGERIAVSGPRAAIGRGRANAVVLADDSISRVHAELHRNRDGGVSLTDMDSLNGTWVNDGRVSGTRSIGAGDVIRLGDVQVRLVLP